MLSEIPASDVQYSGIGASGATPAEASERMASALRAWSTAHDKSRILQLTLLPAVASPSPASPADAFGVIALIAYTDPPIDASSAAEAVAAAVEEIHEAQVASDEVSESSGLRGL